MKTSGYGTITKKGLEIFKYCKTNDIALEFNNYYATSDNVSLSTISNSNNTTYGNITDRELEVILDGASETYATGSVSASESYNASDNTYLPLLMSLVSNDYSEDLDIYSIFLTAKDPKSKKISVASTTSFTIGDGVEDQTTHATGTIHYVDSTNNILYIKNITESSSGLNFVAGNTIVDTNSLATQTMSTVEDAYYVVYQGVPSVNEKQDIYVADASSFTAVTGYISNSAGASALIDSITGTKLTVDRKNVLQFARGDGVDNVATYVGTETNIVADPKMNLTASTVLPVSYVSDGSDILMRIILRYSSGFPENLSFVNPSVTEIEIHNVQDDAHFQFRMLTQIQLAELARDVRDQKRKLDAVVYKNGLLS